MVFWSKQAPSEVHVSLRLWIVARLSTQYLPIQQLSCNSPSASMTHLYGCVLAVVSLWLFHVESLAEFVIPGFAIYTIEAFVMDVPEDKNVLLGMPWFRDNNPDIDWVNNTNKPRTSATAVSIRPCIRPHSAGAPRNQGAHAPTLATDDAFLQYVTCRGHHSSHGFTRIVEHGDLDRLLGEDDNEFLLFVADGATSAKEDQAWESLKHDPVNPYISRYKDVFRSELPTKPAARDCEFEASIELKDEVHVYRKQFPLSAQMKDVIRAWTQEMLTANISRKNRLPRTVRRGPACAESHDLNAKMHVPATLLGRTRNTWPPAMDLLCCFRSD